MNATKAMLDMKEVFYIRQFFYDVLRRFFVEEPSRDYLTHFIEENLIDLLPFVEESDVIQAGILDIKTYLSTHDILNNEEDYQNLHWDYTRMFIGPFDIPAPPWESVYVRKDQLLFQENTMQVRRLYENFGYEIKDKNIEAEDHIGLELDFMFHLNQLSIGVIEENDFKTSSNLIYLLGEQQRFLTTHLLAFVTEFSQDIVEHANTRFFSGMAKLLKGYLELDSHLLQQLLKMNQSK